MSETEWPDMEERPRFAGPVFVAIVLFIGLVTIIPLVWSLLPLSASGALSRGYLGAAMLFSSAVASSMASGSMRRSAAIATLVVASLLVLSVVGGCRAFDRLTQGFSVTTIEARVPSPSGRLVVVDEHLDQGALGGSDSVTVRGRLLPGVVSWAYEVPIPDDSYPDHISWSGNDTLTVDGRTYPIPGYITATAW